MVQVRKKGFPVRQVMKPMTVLAPYIASCYESSRFCDLTLVTMNNMRIHCHKMVLASLSRGLRGILAACDEESEAASVHLPEFNFQEVKAVVDRIYASVGECEVEIPSTDVTRVLGIESCPAKRETEDSEEDDELPDVEVEIKAEVDSEDEVPLKRRGRPKKRRGPPRNGDGNWTKKDQTGPKRRQRKAGKPAYKEEDSGDEGKNKTGVEHLQDIFEDAKDEVDYESDGWDQNTPQEQGLPKTPLF